MSDALLTVDNLHKAYPMGPTQLGVLHGCKLRVQPGEFVAIMGKSGSGKSTLLQILGALDAADAGDVRFAAESIGAAADDRKGGAAAADRVLRGLERVLIFLLKILITVALFAFPVFLLVFPLLLFVVPTLLHWSLYAALYTLGGLIACTLLLVAVLVARLVAVDVIERRRTTLRRRAFGFVFQSYHLLPELTVFENVLVTRMVGSSVLGWLTERRQARADTLAVLERMGLTERLRHRPDELSGGERQRVAIARALVHRPQILFADEPTGNLDAEAGAELMALIAELAAEGQTIVMVTHDAGVAARADRVLVLEEGMLRNSV
jgi:ABC-type lipoprotein export system ATPase subunit